MNKTPYKVRAAGLERVRTGGAFFLSESMFYQKSLFFFTLLSALLLPVSLAAKDQLRQPIHKEASPAIQQVADSFTAEDPFYRMHDALKYIIEKFAYDPWLDRDQLTRSAEQLFQDRTLGGCSDYSVVGLALFRAMGFECRLVLTVSRDWMERVQTNQLSLAFGHSFIEVKIDGTWYLVDPNHFTLYDHYDPDEPFYPHTEVFMARGYDFKALGLQTTADAIAMFYKRALTPGPPWREPTMKERVKVEFHLPHLFTSLGDVLASKKIEYLALKRYAKALQLDPKYVPTYVSRAALYLRQKKYQQALKDLDAALKLAPENVRAYHYRAKVHKALGNVVAMKRDMDSAALLKNK